MKVEMDECMIRISGYLNQIGLVCAQILGKSQEQYA
jgi:hypothetical protein